MSNKYSIIDNYDKLPDDIKSEFQNISDIEIKILHLFQNEPNLDIDNILVGLFIEYGITFKQKELNIVVKKLHKNNHLSLHKNIYSLKSTRKKVPTSRPKNGENNSIEK